MADGGRAGYKRTERSWTHWEERELHRASTRLGAMFGYGGGLSPLCAMGKASATAAEDASELRGDQLAVATLGRTMREKAIHGPHKTQSTKLRAWRIQAGVAAVPVCVPQVEGMAALSWAGLDRQGLDLLLTYCRQDPAAWLRAERLLHPPRPPMLRLAVWRDAMARIMFPRVRVGADPRSAGARNVVGLLPSLDARAKALQVRAADYRQQTRAAEDMLREELISAAVAVNGAARFRWTVAGSSQGNALRAAELWRKDLDTYAQSRRIRRVATGR